MPSRCVSPLERVRAYWPLLSINPTNSSAFSTFFSASPLLTPLILKPYDTFWNTVELKTPTFGNTRVILRLNSISFSRACPREKKVISPRSGFSIRAQSLRNVDLPHPFGPISTYTPLLSKAQEQSFRTGFSL